MRAAGFEIGIFTGGRTNDLPEIRAAGFDIVTGPASRDFLNTARDLGLRVFASPETSAGGRFSPKIARRAIQRFDRHPALWAWYLVDEPDLSGTPPEQVAAAQRFFKSVPARKPTAAVFFQGDESRYYSAIPDIVMVDKYPVPWLPLAAFGQHVELARLSAGPKKPMYAIVQAFDWSYAAQVLPGETNLRPPTRAEMRCMTYEALARGANGVFYYSHEMGAWKLRVQTEVWEDLQAVVAEVRRLKPLFDGQHLWWHRRFEIPNRQNRFNAALQPSVTTTLLEVSKPEGTVAAGRYLVAVNTTPVTQTVQFDGPKKGMASLAVLAQNRMLIGINGVFRDQFEPYGVQVYGPF